MKRTPAHKTEERADELVVRSQTTSNGFAFEQKQALRAAAKDDDPSFMPPKVPYRGGPTFDALRGRKPAGRTEYGVAYPETPDEVQLNHNSDEKQRADRYPDRKIPLQRSHLNLPSFVRLHKKSISRRYLMGVLGNHFEGTEFDMTLGSFAGPFGNPNRWERGSGPQLVPGQFPRAVSIHRTSYALVGEAFSGDGYVNAEEDMVRNAQQKASLLNHKLQEAAHEGWMENHPPEAGADDGTDNGETVFGEGAGSGGDTSGFSERGRVGGGVQLAASNDSDAGAKHSENKTAFWNAMKKSLQQAEKQAEKVQEEQIARARAKMARAVKTFSPGVMWMCADQPAHGVFLPIFAGSMGVATELTVGNVIAVRREEKSSWWANNLIANMLERNYRVMNVDVQARQQAWQDWLEEAVDSVRSGYDALQHSAQSIAMAAASTLRMPGGDAKHPRSAN